MQAATILAALQRVATSPALGGVFVKSVAIAATRELSGASVMTVTWSMPDVSAMISAPALAGVSGSMLSRPSDSAILLVRDLASLAEIEDAVMQAAWTLGAWNLVRIEKSPIADSADWQNAKYGVANDFGINPYVIAGQTLLRGDASPSSAKIAASEGYTLWRFVPLAIATPLTRQRFADKDKTLMSDCTRKAEPSHHRAPWSHPQTPGLANEHQYQLGRANHGNRSKSNNERKA